MITTDPPSFILRQAMIDLGWFEDPEDSDPTWPLYTTFEPDAPNDCATIYDTTPIKDGIAHATGEFMQHYGVQIRVRATTHAKGWAKLGAVLSNTKDLSFLSVSLDGREYEVEAVVPTSGVISMGYDEKRRSLFVLNALATIKEI